MAQPRCRRRKLSIGRGVLCDYLRCSGSGTTAAAERTMQLADVVEARRQAWPRPSWGAIFTKAFALAARNHPEMRQAYLSFPWGHIGEFEYQIGSIILSRQVNGEDMIFLAHIVRPEEQTLTELDDHLRRFQEDPVESIRPFREALLFARLPRLIRRFVWWLALNVLTRRRARHFGTFGVTTMSPFGARTLEVPSLWGAFMHYGVMTETGEVPVGISFDHRVMDGAVVGYTLLEMEQVLHHQITAELRGMRRSSVA